MKRPQVEPTDPVIYSKQESDKKKGVLRIVGTTLVAIPMVGAITYSLVTLFRFTGLWTTLLVCGLLACVILGVILLSLSDKV
jgi:hypothetical protein